jgi:arylsulfatase A-like enzyme
MMLKRFLPALLLLLASCAAPPNGPDRRARSEPANIVIIIADDLGTGDLSVYGSSFRTPHMDALAAAGVRTTAAYATAAVCAPSRAAIMTGRYQQRTGFEYQLEGETQRAHGLATEETTLAEALKPYGYATGLIGKWHLGLSPDRHPIRQGFDTYYGFRGGQALYGSLSDPEMLSHPAPARDPDYWLTFRPTEATAFQDQDRTVPAPQYATDAFTERATAFIRQNSHKPFLLVVAYSAPHTPLQALRSHEAKVSDIREAEQRTYRALVNELDEGVGAIRRTLEEEGLTGSTLIMLTSDNGCPDYINGACSNRPLNGFKRHLLEGGVRVPFIAAWPGSLPAGGVFDGLASNLDILPTALAAAGVRPAGPLDGVDLLPFFSGRRSGDAHPALYWKSYPSYAIRQGRWKLMANAGAEGGMVRMLFDLETDPSETTNVIERNAGLAARLEADWERWSASLPPARWPSSKVFDAVFNGVAVKAVN